MSQDSPAKRPSPGLWTLIVVILLPAVVLILVAVVLAGAASVQQVRNGDAAASAARLLARGDDVGEARRTVERMAGEEARLAHEEGDGWVTVTVSHPGPGPLGWIEPIALEAGAAAPLQHPNPGEAS